MDACANNLVFSMPMLLKCNWSSALFCRDNDLIPFIAIPYMTTSSLKGQYVCTSFTTSALVVGWPCITQVKSVPVWSSSRSAHLILLHHAFHNVCTCFYDPFVRLFPSISLSLCWLWLCLDNQSGISSWGPDLYRILMLYWWACSMILWNMCD